MLKPNNANHVILAITCLHNYLSTKKTTRSLYTPFGSLDHETSDGQIVPGTWREQHQTVLQQKVANQKIVHVLSMFEILAWDFCLVASLRYSINVSSTFLPLFYV